MANFEPVTRIEKLLSEIAENTSGGGGGGGSGLPAVTADDNGDVLTVVEGEWAKAAPSGGGSDIFVVTYTDNSGTLTYDKTFAEIYAAYKAGAMVIAKFESAYILLGGIEFEAPDEPMCMNFYTFSTNGADVSVFHIYHYAAYGGDPEESLYTIVDLTGTVRT